MDARSQDCIDKNNEYEVKPLVFPISYTHLLYHTVGVQIPVKEFEGEN